MPLYHFWDIKCQIIACLWNLGQGSFNIIENNGFHGWPVMAHETHMWRRRLKMAPYDFLSAIQHAIISIALLSCTIFEIFDIEEYCDTKIFHVTTCLSSIGSDFWHIMIYWLIICTFHCLDSPRLGWSPLKGVPLGPRVSKLVSEN